MASISKLRGGRWRARYRTPDGASRSQTFARRVDAERFLTGVEHQKLVGGYVDPRAGRVTVESFAEQWRAGQVWRPSTAERTEIMLRRHVYPTLGARPLASVRPSEVQAWVKGLTLTLAPSTVEGVYRMLVAIYRAAQRDRRVTISPCEGIKLPRRDDARVEPLTVEQVHALADAAPERFRAAIITGAAGGMRQGEVFGLTADRVRWLKREIVVDRQLVTVSGRVDLGPPKTRASNRVVPASDELLRALARHLGRFPVGSGGLVFTTDTGAPVARNRMGETWRATVLRAGMPDGTHFHDLRHFAASALIRAGCSVKVVQAFLGHATAAETLDTYSHLWPDDDDRARAALDSMLVAIEAPVSSVCHDESGAS